jgi:iron-sulfur cluster assembly protein
MIQLTATAVGKVREVLDQEKANLPAGGLRVFVQGGGCSGFRYGLALDEAAEGDQVFDQDGVKLIVDPMSLQHLDGAEIDYREDGDGGGFAINNPNSAPGCSCSHSDSCGSGGCE